MKLTVQVQFGQDQQVDRCFLVFDKEGMEFLKSRLSAPFFKKDGDHLHFLSQEWGTGELNSKPYFEGCPVVHHLELFYLQDTETR
jgi:hypothetical protein